MTQLRHLELVRYSIAGGAAAVAFLLARLQPLQQLTHLQLQSALNIHEPNPPAAAYSALTASSVLQHLALSGCKLPVGVWQHLFSAGRQLPHLTSLHVNHICHPPLLVDAIIPKGDLLVSCCPKLQVCSS
jgi:hypothetical protein